MSQATGKTALVTGANGFIGQPLCREMLRQGWQVRAAVRAPCEFPVAVETVSVGAIDGETNGADALRDIDVVIHLAARVHVMEDTAADPLAEFLKVNTQGTANLARQAAAAGVKRLVYVSTIKVNGEQTTETQPFVESGEPNPQDAYSISKWQAEQALHGVARETGLEVVILRPPLVYGPGVKGNFIRLLEAIDKGIPLPLAGVRNKRSLIYLDNLAGAPIVCAGHSPPARPPRRCRQTLSGARRRRRFHAGTGAADSRRTGQVRQAVPAACGIIARTGWIVRQTRIDRAHDKFAARQ